MSRCLPFPPPNYVKNGIGGEALLQQLEFRRKRIEYSKKKDKKRCHDDDTDDDGEGEEDIRRSNSENNTPSEELEKMETSKLEYTKLTLNCVPIPLQMTLTDFEDEEWLSRKNIIVSNGETIGTKHVSNISTGICQGIQPLACYLPHADIYALPYVVPF